MDENDALSEYNKIPLDHNHTSDTVYSIIYFKVEICSHTSFPALILLKPNNHYNHGFPNTFGYNHYVYSDYLVCSAPVLLTLYVIEYL